MSNPVLLQVFQMRLYIRSVREQKVVIVFLLMNILIQNRQTNTLRGVFTRVEAEEDVLLK